MLERYVAAGRCQADFSEVTVVGMDETSRARGHSHIGLFMNLMPGCRRVLVVGPDRTAETVGLFRKDFSPGMG